LNSQLRAWIREDRLGQSKDTLLSVGACNSVIFFVIVIGQNKRDVADFQSLGQLVNRNHRRIPPSALELSRC
jgi:hypothetical protein